MDWKYSLTNLGLSKHSDARGTSDLDGGIVDGDDIDLARTSLPRIIRNAFLDLDFVLCDSDTTRLTEAEGWKFKPSWDMIDEEGSLAGNYCRATYLEPKQPFPFTEIAFRI